MFSANCYPTRDTQKVVGCTVYRVCDAICINYLRLSYYKWSPPKAVPPQTIHGTAKIEIITGLLASFPGLGVRLGGLPKDDAYMTVM